jgi:hypothetical protein
MLVACSPSAFNPLMGRNLGDKAETIFSSRLPAFFHIQTILLGVMFPVFSKHLYLLKILFDIYIDALMCSTQ